MTDARRRDFLKQSLAAASGLCASKNVVWAELAPTSPSRRRRIGVFSYSFRQKVDHQQPVTDSGKQVLDLARTAGGSVAMLWPSLFAQLGPEDLKALRARAEQLDLLLEPYGGERYAPAFEDILRRSAALGAKVVGCYSGWHLRPDRIATLEAWDAHVARFERRLRELEPIVRRLGLKLAVENHWDLTTEELHGVIRKIDSPHIGVLFDVGNSLGTLDDPVEAARLLGPYTVATHVKDFAAEEGPRGYQVTIVPLGTGSLRLEEITAELLRRVGPEVHLCVEMFIASPLEVPWLEDRFWAAFRSKTARQVAATLAHLRRHPYNRTQFRAIQQWESVPRDQLLSLEVDCVRRSVAFLQGLLARQG